jgi:replicative DNA helicase
VSPARLLLEDIGTLPYSEEAERAVLGGMLLDNRQAPIVCATLKATDFFSARAARIFRALATLSAGESALDFVTLRDELERADRADVNGDLAWIASVVDGTARSANVEHYARIVLDRARRRQLMREAERLKRVAGNGSNAAELAAAIAEWRKVLTDARTDEAVSYETATAVIGRAIPGTPWIVDRLIAEGDVTLLSGRGGIGKSWLALSLAVAVASGRSAFGHFALTRRARVGFLDLESRPWEIDARVSRLIGGAELQELDDLILIRERLRLDRPAEVRRLMNVIESERLELLVVDSLRRMVSGDTNKGEVTSALFVEVLDPIRLETGCGFVIVSHTRKRTGETDLDAPDEAMAGSADLRNMADAHIGVEAREDRLCITPTKTRHALLPEPFLVALSGLEGEDGVPVSVRHLGNADRASDAVQDAMLVLLRGAGDTGMLRGELIGRSHYSERSVGLALGQLVRRRMATKRTEGKQTRYTLSTATAAHDGKALAAGS